LDVVEQSLLYIIFFIVGEIIGWIDQSRRDSALAEQGICRGDIKQFDQLKTPA
jgi:hypothetical protein